MSDNRQQLTIATGLYAAARQTPDKTAIVEGRRSLRFAELAARINRVSNALQDNNLKRGDRVCLLAPNCLEYIEIVAGSAELGIAVVTAAAYVSAEEFAAIVRDSDPQLLIVSESLYDLALCADCLANVQIIVLGSNYEDWLASAAPDKPATEVDETDTFAIAYTSGTSGNPKGVMVSHRSRALTFFAMAAEYGCYGADDRALCIAPMSHGAGLAFALAPVFFGGTVYLQHCFDPEKTLAALTDHSITNVFMVPTHFSALFDLPPEVLHKYRPNTLRTLISNAAPLAQTMKEKIVAYFGEGRLFECYGSTEAGIVTNLHPADQLRKKHCVGRPFPMTELRVLDEQGQDVLPGGLGEIYSHSPYLFNGYWNRPHETVATFRDGWVSAGDLGRIDDEGHLYIDGRKKDMIISGGINIYPREIEDVLCRHAAIVEAAVVGRQDEHWGESVAAFIVLGSDLTVSENDLSEHCRTHLARPKVPKAFRFIDAIPRNASGKVLKRVLRDSFSQ